MSTEEEKKIEDVQPSTSKESIGDDSESRVAAKRGYLEVNEAGKYKSLLLKPLETKKMKPSEVMSRVREFLPMFKESTAKLFDENKDNLDALNIENVEDDEDHIEMNLALIPDDSDDSDDSDEQEYEEEESEKSENESEEDSDDLGDTLQLGFKVKDPSKINKLKTSSNKLGKDMIQVIESIDDHDSNDKPATSE